MTKSISLLLKKDIQLAAGPLETATELQSGVERAIHTMLCMFKDGRTDAVILFELLSIH